MSSVLEGLKPQAVYEYFEQICAIPHVSYHVSLMSKYLEDFALLHHLNYVQDEDGNTVIYKPASAGYESHDGVILQGHIDMVGAKTTDCTLDMVHEAITLDPTSIKKGYISAKNTTLGGDDGIAVAYMLAILSDSSLAHPRLECVFTVNEEVGLLGASSMDCTVLTGRTLLNIDSEDEGIFVTGSAGGAHMDCRIPVRYEEDSLPIYELTIDGLTGGHSGTYIGTGRPSAIKLLGRVMRSLDEQSELRITSLYAGEVDNAIAPRCVVSFMAEETALEDYTKRLALLQVQLRNEYKGIDEGITLSLQRKEEGGRCLCYESTRRMITFLSMMPYGVIGRNATDLSLVETSLNPGTIRLNETCFEVGFLVRSSIDSAKEALMEELQYLTEFLGGEISVEGNYPGWDYNPDSPIRKVIETLYEKMYDKKPVFMTIHAGLECGIFYNAIPGLDVISYGPDLFDIHTPMERLMIDSASRVYNFTVKLLAQL